MPSNLIDGDGEFQLGSLLIGKAPFWLSSQGGPAVTGLFDLNTKSQDQVLDHADGSFLGPDFEGSTIVTLSVSVTASSAETRDAMAAQVLASLQTLRSAWAASLVDVDLWGQLEGLGLFKLTGKPRGFHPEL